MPTSTDFRALALLSEIAVYTCTVIQRSYGNFRDNYVALSPNHEG